MAPAKVGSDGNPSSILGFLAGVAVGLLLFSDVVANDKSEGKLEVALRLFEPEVEAPPSIGEAEREFVLLTSFFFLVVAASESLESEELEEPSLFFCEKKLN